MFSYFAYLPGSWMMWLRAWKDVWYLHILCPRALEKWAMSQRVYNSLSSWTMSGPMAYCAPGRRELLLSAVINKGFWALGGLSDESYQSQIETKKPFFFKRVQGAFLSYEGPRCFQNSQLEVSLVHQFPEVFDRRKSGNISKSLIFLKYLSLDHVKIPTYAIN